MVTEKVAGVKEVVKEGVLQVVVQECSLLEGQAWGAVRQRWPHVRRTTGLLLMVLPVLRLPPSVFPPFAPGGPQVLSLVRPPTWQVGHRSLVVESSVRLTCSRVVYYREQKIYCLQMGQRYGSRSLT